MALLPPGDIDVRGENIVWISFGECLALLPPGDIDASGESTGRISDERLELLPSETKVPDLAPAAATAAGPARAGAGGAVGGALNDVELEPRSLGRHVIGVRGDGL